MGILKNSCETAGGGVNMLLPRWFENVGFFARIDTKKATGR